MADAKDPLRHLLDVMVYAPIGLLTIAQRELPQLVAAGKTRCDNQITVARFVGQMAVKQGKKELERRLDGAEQARAKRRNNAVDDHVDSVDTTPASTATGSSTANDAPAATSLPEAIIELVAESPLLDAPVEAPTILPIDGYDSLAASQVVIRLDSLTSAELAVVEAYETTHRARRTILGKINQLQAR